MKPNISVPDVEESHATARRMQREFLLSCGWMEGWDKTGTVQVWKKRWPGCGTAMCDMNTAFDLERAAWANSPTDD